MKKLLLFASITLLLVGTSGCRIAECWRQAWQSRFGARQTQTVVVADPCCDPCVVTDPCNACVSPCAPVPGR